jgi:hypothetical protein
MSCGDILRRRPPVLPSARAAARAGHLAWLVSRAADQAEMGELGLRPEPHTLGFGNLSAGIAPGEDPLPLIFGHRRQECDETAPDRRGEVQVRLCPRP